MLADDAIRFLPRVISLIIKGLKLILKVIIFFGLYWFIVALAPSSIYEIVTDKSSFKVPMLVHFTDVLLIIACILAILTTIQSFIRIFKKDHSFNIFKTILGAKEKQGFIDSLKGDTISLCSASNVKGFFFGKQKGKYVTKPENADGHILVIGGAGSGKTAGIAIPTLMTWKEPVFAIDIKGELYEKTSKKRNPEKIKIFNPMDKNAFGYDPFYMLKNTDDLSGEARALALSICPLPPVDIKEPYWIQNAQNMLTGFIIYFFEKSYNFSKTMSYIKSKPVKLIIAEIMESDNQKAIAEISQFDGMDDKGISGTFTELSNHITVFATNDDLQRALSGEGSYITPEDLENGYDIFCCIPEHKIEQWKDLIGMIVNQFLKSFERRKDGNKKPILFLIDEFPRLGKIETISNGLATLRSKKIHIALFVQSKSQLNAIYGKDIAEVIADNCSYKAILRASEPNTQDWCSRLVGTYDKNKSTSNYNADIVGIGKGQGTSTTTEEKRIIKPEEFAYLQDIVCVLPNGYRRITKVMYFQDKAFTV